MKHRDNATRKLTAYVSMSKFGLVKVILPQQDHLLLAHFTPEQRTFAPCSCQLCCLLSITFSVTVGFVR